MKKKFVWISVFAIVSIFLSVNGCASSNPSIGDTSALPGSDESVIIFYRGILHFAAPPYSVYVNGIEQFSLKANQSGRIVVPNGVHDFTGYIPRYNNSARPKKVSLRSEEITFEIKAVREFNSSINIEFIEKKRTQLR